MKLYRTTQGAFVEEEGRFYPLSTVGSVEAWDALVCDMDLEAKAMAAVGQNSVVSLDPTTILSPVGSQEVWAAGVTYYRSRKARMEESKDAGGGDTTECTQPSDRSCSSKPRDGGLLVPGMRCASAMMPYGRSQNRS